MTGDPFEGIAAAPPQLTSRDAETLARERYGIEASARALVSERDQNFLLTAADGDRTILKIASAAEDPVVTDFQVQAMMHIAARGGVQAPSIIPTTAGEPSFRYAHAGSEHTVRLVTYLRGTLFEDVAPDEQLASTLGRELARLHIALDGFSHPGERQALLWDMTRAPSLRRLLVHIEDPGQRDLVAATLDEFEACGLPALGSLPGQVIHNDANPSNVLVDASGAVTGLIDFGDMLRLPRIVELGVAGAYFRVESGDPLALVNVLAEGYRTLCPLTDPELALLPLLVRTRLATTVAILCWRRSLRGPDDEYLVAAFESEQSASPFLRRLSGA